MVVVEALNQSFPTIATSGTILTCAGFAVGRLTSNAIIASLGKALGAGTLVSIILVMTVLPQILLVFDKVIDRTEFNRGAVKQDKEAKKGNKEESVTDDAMRITEEDGGTKTEEQVTETADREGGADDEA